MNYEHMYTKNINRLLIHILDFWQRSYEYKLIYFYEFIDEFM